MSHVTPETFDALALRLIAHPGGCSTCRPGVNCAEADRLIRRCTRALMILCVTDPAAARDRTQRIRAAIETGRSCEFCSRPAVAVARCPGCRWEKQLCRHHAGESHPSSGTFLRHLERLHAAVCEGGAEGRAGR